MYRFKTFAITCNDNTFYKNYLPSNGRNTSSQVAHRGKMVIDVLSYSRKKEVMCVLFMGDLQTRKTLMQCNDDFIFLCINLKIQFHS